MPRQRKGKVTAVCSLSYEYYEYFTVQLQWNTREDEPV